MYIDNTLVTRKSGFQNNESSMIKTVIKTIAIKNGFPTGETIEYQVNQKENMDIMKLKITITLLIAFMAALTLQAQDFCYYKKSINMRIERDAFHVAGLYYLKGEPNTTQQITYPFPEGPAFGKVDSINIYSMSGQEAIVPDRVNEHSIVFTIDFGDSDEYLLHVHYAQELKGSWAEYNLACEGSREKPIEYADLHLIAPSGMKIKRWSIPPKDTIEAGENSIYHWSMENYNPSKNLVFRFKKY